MPWRGMQRVLGVVAWLAMAGCGGDRIVRACMGGGAPAESLDGVALYRVDFYAPSVACDGADIAADAPAPLLSRSFVPGQPITLDAPPGSYTVALTAWADASASSLVGGGCVAAVDFQPGSQICLDITLDHADQGVDPGDAAPRDLVDRVDGGNVCPPFATFCDDFEDGLLHFPGREVSGPGMVAADSVRPYHANLALHATTLADTSDMSADAYNRQRAKRTLATPAAAGTTFALRAWVWFSFVAGSPAVRLFQLSNATGSSIALGLQGGDWGIGSSWTAPTSTTPVVQGQWTCVEWIVDLAAQGRARILINGAPVLDVQQQTADPADSYDTLLVGVRAEKTGATELFVDDLAYGPQPIGCN